MKIDLATPALLFPAISLLLLAFTNRFLSLAALIRTLHDRYKETRDPVILSQINNLRRRVILIRDMQAYGVGSLLFCVAAMLLIYFEWNTTGASVFGISLVLMMISLILSIREIQISIEALKMHLRDIESDTAKND